jgi:hypothetical protein
MLGTRETGSAGRSRLEEARMAVKRTMEGEGGDMRGREIRRLRSEAGVALAFVALLLFVFLGLAALAVDMGLLYGARTEAQRTADSAALAGASMLFDAPTDAALARSTAIEWASRNPVQGIAPTVLPEDVDVDLGESLVRVRVILTEAHQANAPIRNIFGRALGFLNSDVAVFAAAQAAVASGINCPLPFVLIDRWWDGTRGGLAEGNDLYVPPGDIYNAGPLAREDWPGSPGLNTGFGTADKGRVLRIYPGSTGDSPQPGWYYPLALEDPGADAYRNWIQGCPNPDATFNLGDQIPIEPGRMVGPTTQGFQNLYNQDANAFWGTQAGGYVNAPPPTPGPGGAPGGCVMRPGAVDDSGNNVCVSSPRVKPMITIDPGDNPPGSGRQTIPLSHFVGVFVECVGVYNPPNCVGNINSNNPNQGVWVRFIEYRGINPMPVGQGDPGSLVRILVLVE